MLRAHRIELVDSRGVLRALLSIIEEVDFNHVSLGLYDDHGKERASFHTNAEAAGVDFWENDNQVACLSSSRDGRASLVLADIEGRPVKVVDNQSAT